MQRPLTIMYHGRVLAQCKLECYAHPTAEIGYVLHLPTGMKMPNQPTNNRPRRRRRGRFLENLLDPEKERPILKMLLQTFGPMLMTWLTMRLPIILAEQQPENTDEEQTA